MTIANLEHAFIYWVPSRRRITARSVCAIQRRAVPTDAILIGCYAHPHPVAAFLEDLALTWKEAS